MKMIKSILLLLFSLCLFYVVKSKCPKLVVPFGQVNCTDRATDTESYYYYFDETSSCIPTCKSYVSQTSDACVDSQCMPGYVCEKRCSSMDLRNYTCEVKEDCVELSGGKNTRVKCGEYCIAQHDASCMAYHCNTDDYKNTTWRASQWKPTCDNDGNYVAKQCKGGLTGRCMCYSQNGKRIFGQALRKESANMTCACSRRKSERETLGKFSYISFHCDSKGNYEKLQCDIVSEQCWCVKAMTGDLTSPVVPIKAMSKLPCYLKSAVGSQYLRMCESEKYARTIVNQKLKLHGAKWVPTSSLICDDDGSYGNYYMESGIAYCTWRDHSKIENWQADSEAQYSGVDCNCARDYKMYKHTQTCSGSGNYNALQQVILDGEAKYYCVDSDGYAKSDLLNEKPNDCSAFY